MERGPARWRNQTRRGKAGGWVQIIERAYRTHSLVEPAARVNARQRRSRAIPAMHRAVDCPHDAIRRRAPTPKPHPQDEGRSKSSG